MNELHKAECQVLASGHNNPRLEQSGWKVAQQNGTRAAGLQTAGHEPAQVAKKATGEAIS